MHTPVVIIGKNYKEKNIKKSKTDSFWGILLNHGEAEPTLFIIFA